MNGFDYFKLALSKYADFTGRARRSEYWYFSLFYLILLVLVVAIEALLFQTVFLYLIGVLAFIIPALAVTVRRLHDTGRSGWTYFVSLIPLVGGIILLVWLCQDSNPGVNKWGRNPKELSDDLADHLIDSTL